MRKKDKFQNRQRKEWKKRKTGKKQRKEIYRTNSRRDRRRKSEEKIDKDRKKRSQRKKKVEKNDRQKKMGEQRDMNQWKKRRRTKKRRGRERVHDQRLHPWESWRPIGVDSPCFKCEVQSARRVADTRLLKLKLKGWNEDTMIQRVLVGFRRFRA